MLDLITPLTKIAHDTTRTTQDRLKAIEAIGRTVPNELAAAIVPEVASLVGDTDIDVQIAAIECVRKLQTNADWYNTITGIMDSLNEKG